MNCEIKRTLILSDFDGTLTLCDTMLDIIIFHCGRLGLCLALLRVLPWLLLMKLGLYSNHHAKERLLKHCFGGMTRQELQALAKHYSASRRDKIIRQSLYQQIEQSRKDGAEVIVISASPEIWVSQFVPDITVLGTQLEFVDDVFTGRFASPNCYGPEKVRRLLDYIPSLSTHRSDYHITAYGDSRGDREMFAFADNAVLVK